MKVYFATWLTDRTLGQSLTKKGGNCRLLSYYFIREQETPPKQFERYVRRGICDIRKNKK